MAGRRRPSRGAAGAGDARQARGVRSGRGRRLERHEAGSRRTARLQLTISLRDREAPNVGNSFRGARARSPRGTSSDHDGLFFRAIDFPHFQTGRLPVPTPQAAAPPVRPGSCRLGLVRCLVPPRSGRPRRPASLRTSEPSLCGCAGRMPAPHAWVHDGRGGGQHALCPSAPR
jgi:hypothetical protein